MVMISHTETLLSEITSQHIVCCTCHRCLTAANKGLCADDINTETPLSEITSQHLLCCTCHMCLTAANKGLCADDINTETPLSEITSHLLCCTCHRCLTAAYKGLCGDDIEHRNTAVRDNITTPIVLYLSQVSHSSKQGFVC